MTTAKEWLEKRCHSLKGVDEGVVKEIQHDVCVSLIGSIDLASRNVIKGNGSKREELIKAGIRLALEAILAENKKVLS